MYDPFNVIIMTRAFAAWILFSWVFFSCSGENQDFNTHIEVLEEFASLGKMMESEKDKILVVNFWATSCPPCLKEMPHFNELEKEYSDRGVKIILASLDRARDLESRVYPFVKRLNILPEVVVLEDQNYSSWTEMIDPSWY
jgi:thiol-disulfide isomerase/thioredoxin